MLIISPVLNLSLLFTISFHVSKKQERLHSSTIINSVFPFKKNYFEENYYIEEIIIQMILHFPLCYFTFTTFIVSKPLAAALFLFFILITGKLDSRFTKFKKFYFYFIICELRFSLL